MIPNSVQYRILHDQLKKEILSGKYKIGEILPSENHLAVSRNLARSTVRQALAQLEQEGYIVKKQGKGSIVSSRHRTLGLLDYRGFTASVGSQTEVRTLSIQVPQIVRWPEDFYFNIPEDVKKIGCLRFSRVRFVKEDPLMWETTYLPNSALPGFSRLYNPENSFFDFLAQRYHLEITGMFQEIRAKNADKITASTLGLKWRQPVLEIYRIYSTSRHGFHIYSILNCSTDKYAMSNQSGNYP